MSDTTASALAALIGLSLIFGFVAILGLLLWGEWKLSLMNNELRYMTIGKDWGEVRLDQFTLKCDVHAAVANWYLSRKARQLNGVRHVNEWGDIIFLFGEAKQKFLSE